MTATASDRRDRLRAMLADLKMPGALEAVDGVLAQVDSGAVTISLAIAAAEAGRRVYYGTLAGRPRARLPADQRPARAGVNGADLEQGLRGMGTRARRRDHGGGAHRPAAAPLPYRQHPGQQLPDTGCVGTAA